MDDRSAHRPRESLAMFDPLNTSSPQNSTLPRSHTYSHGSSMSLASHAASALPSTPRSRHLSSLLSSNNNDGDFPASPSRGRRTPSREHQDGEEGPMTLLFSKTHTLSRHEGSSYSLGAGKLIDFGGDTPGKSRRVRTMSSTSEHEVASRSRWNLSALAEDAERGAENRSPEKEGGKEQRSTRGHTRSKSEFSDLSGSTSLRRAQTMRAPSPTKDQPSYRHRRNLFDTNTISTHQTSSATPSASTSFKRSSTLSSFPSPTRSISPIKKHNPPSPLKDLFLPQAPRSPERRPVLPQSPAVVEGMLDGAVSPSPIKKVSKSPSMVALPESPTVPQQSPMKNAPPTLSPVKNATLEVPTLAPPRPSPTNQTSRSLSPTLSESNRSTSPNASFSLPDADKSFLLPVSPLPRPGGSKIICADTSEDDLLRAEAEDEFVRAMAGVGDVTMGDITISGISDDGEGAGMRLGPGTPVVQVERERRNVNGLELPVPRSASKRTSLSLGGSRGFDPALLPGSTPLKRMLLPGGKGSTASATTIQEEEGDGSPVALSTATAGAMRVTLIRPSDSPTAVARELVTDASALSAPRNEYGTPSQSRPKSSAARVPSESQSEKVPAPAFAVPSRVASMKANHPLGASTILPESPAKFNSLMESTMQLGNVSFGELEGMEELKGLDQSVMLARAEPPRSRVQDLKKPVPPTPSPKKYRTLQTFLSPAAKERGTPARPPMPPMPGPEVDNPFMDAGNETLVLRSPVKSKKSRLGGAKLDVSEVDLMHGEMSFMKDIEGMSDDEDAGMAPFELPKLPNRPSRSTPARSVVPSETRLSRTPSLRREVGGTVKHISMPPPVTNASYATPGRGLARESLASAEYPRTAERPARHGDAGGSLRSPGYKDVRVSPKDFVAALNTHVPGRTPHRERPRSMMDQLGAPASLRKPVEGSLPMTREARPVSTATPGRLSRPASSIQRVSMDPPALASTRTPGRPSLLSRRPPASSDGPLSAARLSRTEERSTPARVELVMLPSSAVRPSLARPSAATSTRPSVASSLRPSTTTASSSAVRPALLPSRAAPPATDRHRRLGTSPEKVIEMGRGVATTTTRPATLLRPATSTARTGTAAPAPSRAAALVPSRTNDRAEAGRYSAGQNLTLTRGGLPAPRATGVSRATAGPPVPRRTLAEPRARTIGSNPPAAIVERARETAPATRIASAIPSSSSSGSLGNVARAKSLIARTSALRERNQR